MRRLALVLVVGLCAAAPAGAQMDMGDEPVPVSIEYASFAPAHIQVLAGETVHWHNGSARVHTVTAEDGTWTSDRLQFDTSYSHRFDAPGAFAYYCQVHSFMRGEVDVARLLLNAPKDPAAPNRPYVLAGRAALAPGTDVKIETDTGATVATATVGEDGSFAARVVLRSSATLRAVAGTDASPPVQLLVLDRTVTIRRARHGGRWVVRVSVAPASPGARVVLQLHLRERFGWWPTRRARLDRHSRARFVLRLHRRVPARVALTLRDGATLLAVSRTVHIGRRG